MSWKLVNSRKSTRALPLQQVANESTNKSEILSPHRAMPPTLREETSCIFNKHCPLCRNEVSQEPHAMYLHLKDCMVKYEISNRLNSSTNGKNTYRLTLLKEDGSVIVQMVDLSETLDSIRKRWGISQEYKIKVPALPLFITYESIPLNETPYLKFRNKRSRDLKFVLASKEYFREAKTEATTLQKIQNYITRASTVVHPQFDENEAFLHTLARMRLVERKRRRQFNNTNCHVLLNIGGGPVIPPGTNVDLKVVMSDRSQTVRISAFDSCDTFLEKNWHRFPESSLGKNPSDYALRVVGKSTFFCGPHLLHNYEHIQTCIEKKKEIAVTLVEKNQIPPDNPQPYYYKMLENEETFLGDEPEIKYDHNDLESNAYSKQILSSWGMKQFYRIKLESAKNLSESSLSKVFFVHVQMFNGDEELTKYQVTETAELKNKTASFNYAFQTDLEIANLPRTTKICFTLYSLNKKKDKRKAYGWVNFLVFNYEGFLKTGKHSLNLWLDEEANVIGTCAMNVQMHLRQSNELPVALVVEVEPFPYDIVYPTESSTIQNIALPLAEPNPPSTSVKQAIDQIISRHSLTTLSDPEKDLIWRFRMSYCKNFYQALPKFIRSTNKKNRIAVQEMHSFLRDWAKPENPIDALELLDAPYADSKVRGFAVSQLERLSNVELEDFLLQLVQALKLECYHNSALARFLFQRALTSARMGHYFYWYIKCELLQPKGYFTERMNLLLESFLSMGGTQLADIQIQEKVLDHFNRTVRLLKAEKEPKKIRTIMEQGLTEVNLFLNDKACNLMLDPSISFKRVILDKCKVMDSKMRPLWLVFENSDKLGKNINVIFKSGDDLRQDMLVLQLFHLMDKIWKNQVGVSDTTNINAKNQTLDLKLSPYRVMATGVFEGEHTGVIEAVMGAQTIGGIQKAKTSLVGGTLSESYILEWLADKNRDKGALKDAIENFTSSAAGYCVATYVLGIGDRHADNIMLKEDGHVFHIDYGHILGNFKKKLGIDRETDPFVFTPAWKYAITKGGKDMENFENNFQIKGNLALQILRKNKNLFINLLSLMLISDMPELQRKEDMKFLVDTLSSENHEFAEMLIKIGSALRKQLDDLAHRLAH